MGEALPVGEALTTGGGLTAGGVVARGGVVAIGERIRVAGFALAGVTVLVAEEPAAVRRAWQGLPRDVALVIVTPAAADALGPALLERTRPLTAVMPA